MTIVNNLKRPAESMQCNEVQVSDLKKIKTEVNSDSILPQLVTCYLEEALKTAVKIQNSELQAISLNLIADSPLLKRMAGQLSLPNALIEEKLESNPESYLLSLCSLAKILVFIGYHSEGLSIVHKLMIDSLNLPLDVKTKIFFVFAYLNRNETFEKSIDPENSNNIIFKISEELWIKCDRREEEAYDLEIQNVVEILIKTNPIQALEKARLINDPEKRLNLIKQVLQQNNINIFEVIESLSDFQDHYYQSKLEMNIANQLFEKGLKKEALDFLNKAIEHTFQITDEQNQCELLIEIAKLQKFLDDATNILETLTVITSKLFLIKQRALISLQLADELFEIGLKKAALEMLKTAKENTYQETNENYYKNLCVLAKLQLKMDKNQVTETWKAIADLQGYKIEIYEFLFEMRNRDQELFKDLYSDLNLHDQLFFLCFISPKVSASENLTILAEINKLKEQLDIGPYFSKKESVLTFIKLAEAQLQILPHLSFLTIKDALDSAMNEESDKKYKELLPCFECLNLPIPLDLLSHLEDDYVKVKFFLDNGLKFFENQKPSESSHIEKEERKAVIVELFDRSSFANHKALIDVNCFPMAPSQESSDQGTFDQLPKELKEIIFSQSGIESLLSLQLICKDFKSLETDDFTLKAVFNQLLQRIVDESLTVQDPKQRIETFSCLAQSPLIEKFPDIFAKLTFNIKEVSEGNEELWLREAVEIALLQVKTNQTQQALELAKKINSFRGIKILPSRFEDLLASLAVENPEIMVQSFFSLDERIQSKILKKRLILLKKLAASNPKKALKAIELIELALEKHAHLEIEKARKKNNSKSEFKKHKKSILENLLEQLELPEFLSMKVTINAICAKTFIKEKRKERVSLALNVADENIKLIEHGEQISALFDIAKTKKKISKKDFVEALFIIQAKMLQTNINSQMADFFIQLTHWLSDLNFCRSAFSYLHIFNMFRLNIFCPLSENISYDHLSFRELEKIAKLASKVDYNNFKIILRDYLIKISDEYDGDQYEHNEIIKAMKIVRIANYAIPEDRKAILNIFDEYAKNIVECEFLIFDAKRAKNSDNAIELLHRAFSIAELLIPKDVQVEKSLGKHRLYISILIKIAVELHRFDPTAAMKKLANAFEITKQEKKLQESFVEIFSQTNLLFPIKYLNKMPINSIKMILLNDLAIKLYNRFFEKKLTPTKYTFLRI